MGVSVGANFVGCFLKMCIIFSVVLGKCIIEYTDILFFDINYTAEEKITPQPNRYFSLTVSI